MIVICALALVLPSLLFANELPGHMVLNGDLTAVIKTAEGAQQLSGRMNAYLSLSDESLESGVSVEALNVALFGVDQKMLTGKETVGKPTGVVGFAAIASGEKRQRLQYDPKTRSLVGKVVGRVDMPQFYEMIELKVDPKQDYVEIPTIEATIDVRIELGKMADMKKARGEVLEDRVSAVMTLATSDAPQHRMRAFAFNVRIPYLTSQLVFWPFIEVARNLCIQPVRIMTFKSVFPPFLHFSGDGLAFGQPGVSTQWRKGDVTFTYRDWITLFKPQFSTLSAGETSALLSEVNENDCIEVFFVDRFDPQTMFGGGATFGLGQASSKVISSDENADFGVDLTHLAHEFGHVLGLAHPNPPGPPSTGTLMCPSGFNNDNPKINSQENKNTLSNPLLRFSLKFVSPGPDCQNSTDCGPCP
jgi:hypothetical protein